MVSLFLRNVFFTIVHPGIVAVLIPFWILGNQENTIFDSPFKLSQYAGTVVFFIGVVILLVCIISFAIKGSGTLSPADPTKKLVVAGLYKFSRNPMYIGVITILIGEAVFFQSIFLWIYSLGIFIVFNGFIFLLEEPRLKKDFEKEYDEYCNKVRRWI